jgi:hypothetical protein
MTGRRARSTSSSGTLPSTRVAIRPRPDAPQTMMSASRSSAKSRMPRATRPGRISPVAAIPSSARRATVDSTAWRASAASSERGTVESLELQAVDAHDVDGGARLLGELRGGVGDPRLLGPGLRGHHDALHDCLPSVAAGPVPGVS